jgi:hypothetical protein
MQRDERRYDRNREPGSRDGATPTIGAVQVVRWSVDLLRRWQRYVDQQQCYGQCVEHGCDHPEHHGERLWQLFGDRDRRQWLQRDQRGYDCDREPEPCNTRRSVRRRSFGLLHRWQRDPDQQQRHG